MKKMQLFLKSVQNQILYTFESFGFFGARRFSVFGAAPDRRLKIHPPFEVEPLAERYFPATRERTTLKLSNGEN